MSIVRATYDDRIQGRVNVRVSQERSHDSSHFGQECSLRMFLHGVPTPGRTACAVVYGDRSLSYRQLQTRAAGLAQAAHRTGRSRGGADRRLHRSRPGNGRGHARILMAGGAYVPMDARYPNDRRD